MEQLKPEGAHSNNDDLRGSKSDKDGDRSAEKKPVSPKKVKRRRVETGTTTQPDLLSDEKQSLKLIDQYTAKATEAKKELKNAEDALEQKKQELAHSYYRKEQELLRQFNDAKMALQKEQKMEEAKLDKESFLETKEVRELLLETEKLLDGEKYKISTLSRFPVELYLEIFHHYLEGDMPVRQLALVCVQWRKLLLSNASFWRKIEVAPVPTAQVDWHQDKVRKRIELSQQTPLDVTIDAKVDIAGPWSMPIPHSDALFNFVAHTSPSRWKSLTLINLNHRKGIFDYLEGVGNEGCPKLRILHCEGPMDYFAPIIERIIRSNPNINEFKFNHYDMPGILTKSTILRNISRLSTYGGLVSPLEPLANLCHLEITNDCFDYIPLSLPALPSSVSFRTISRSLLSTQDIQRIEELTMSILNNGQQASHLDFPNLISLRIDYNGLSSIQQISAPRLRQLRLNSTYTGADKEESAKVITLFRDEPDRILIKPRHLDVFLSITTTAAMTVFQTWSEIEHLKIRFSDFSWSGALATALKKRSDPLLPNLVTLRIYSESSTKDYGMHHWQEIAGKMFKYRKRLPLDLVEWQGCDKVVHRLYRPT